ncbi:MAG TPA: ROK family protein [Candidatus Limnocylindrales bacterium]|jgi:glucokinase|nr:ROK family protein [Candidatus Limnocylindrales bacterium]
MNIGIEIGGTKLQLVLGENGKIKERRRLSVEPKLGAPGIRDQIQKTLPQFGSMISAIGVGFGGPVDWRTGKICRSHQIEGWSEFDLGAWLRQLTGKPVRVDNDANVAALGEALHGAGVGTNPVFYVTLGSGVGGGLVVDGRIYHGATPGEAEIGHVRLDKRGTIVESRCSGWAVDRKIRELTTREPDGVLSRLTKGIKEGEAKFLGEAVDRQDPGAKHILGETAEDLAFGLSHVVHLFHPEIIIIGGGLAGVGERLRAAVEKCLAGFVMAAFAPGPRLALAALGEDAVPVGALELAKSA